MASIATLEIKVDASGAITSIRQVKQETDDAAGSAEKMGDKFTRMSTVVSAAAAAAGAALLAGIVKNTIEAEYATAQLDAAVRSTGGAAGFTTDQLKLQAAALQEVSTFGDEAVMQMQAVLLTFTQVKGDNFTRASAAIADMATRMGTDLKSAAVQVGKALNDPILGVSALNRVGVQMTETQKEMIEQFVNMGDVASAQRIILAELETQFGGSAAAARDTLGGALEALKNAFGDALEAGGAFSTGVSDGLNFLADLIPKVREKVDEFIGGIQLLANEAGFFFADFGNAAQRGFGAALIALGRFVNGLGLVVPGLAELSVKLNDIGNNMIQRTLGDSAQLRRYRDEMALAIVSTDKLATAGRTAGNVVTDAFGDIATEATKASDRTAVLKQKIADIGPAVTMAATPFSDDFTPAVEEAVTMLGEEFAGSAKDKVVDFFSVLHDSTRETVGAVQQQFSNLADDVLSIFGTGSSFVGGIAGGLLGSVLSGIADDIFNSGKRFRQAVEVWRDAVNDLDEDIEEWQRARMDPFSREVLDIADWLNDTLGQAFGALGNAPSGGGPLGDLFHRIIGQLSGSLSDIPKVQEILSAGTFAGTIWEDALEAYLRQLDAIKAEHAARMSALDATEMQTDATDRLTDSTESAVDAIERLARELGILAGPVLEPDTGRRTGKPGVTPLGPRLPETLFPETGGGGGGDTFGGTLGGGGGSSLTRSSGVSSVTEVTGNRMLGVLTTQLSVLRSIERNTGRRGPNVADDVNRNAVSSGNITVS